MEIDWSNPIMWVIVAAGMGLTGWMFFKMNNISLPLKIFATIVSAPVIAGFLMVWPERG